MTASAAQKALIAAFADLATVGGRHSIAPADAIAVAGSYNPNRTLRICIDTGWLRRSEDGLERYSVTAAGYRKIGGLSAADEIYERIRAKVDTSAGPDGCHPWIGYRTPEGYGRFKIYGRQTAAHRWILGYLRGAPLGDGEVACHRCDNPPCCNPSHLFAGTQADNQQDCKAKGRRPKPPTVCRKGLHRLTSETVYVDRSGRRRCKACHNSRVADWRRAESRGKS